MGEEGVDLVGGVEVDHRIAVGRLDRYATGREGGRREVDHALLAGIVLGGRHYVARFFEGDNYYCLSFSAVFRALGISHRQLTCRQLGVALGVDSMPGEVNEYPQKQRRDGEDGYDAADVADEEVDEDKGEVAYQQQCFFQPQLSLGPLAVDVFGEVWIIKFVHISYLVFHRHARAVAVLFFNRYYITPVPLCQVVFLPFVRGVFLPSVAR